MVFVDPLDRHLVSRLNHIAVKHYSEDFQREFIEHLHRTVGGRLFFVSEVRSPMEHKTSCRRRLSNRDNAVLERLAGGIDRLPQTNELQALPLRRTPRLQSFTDIKGQRWRPKEGLPQYVGQIPAEECRGTLNSHFQQMLNLIGMLTFADFCDVSVSYHSRGSISLFHRNHDTQPRQSLEKPIDAFFKPLAYALILLRSEGYPCVFYGDLYGIKGPHPEEPSCRFKLPELCLARKLYAYGEQRDYFDSPHCIGWTRLGTWDRPYGLACLMSNGRPNGKRMYVGEARRGEVWTDVLGWEPRGVEIDTYGYGMFTCQGNWVAVYVNRRAEGRERFGKL